VATSIRKDEFVKKHGDTDNLYNVALRSCLKRLYRFLDTQGQSHCITNIIFEQRGKQEDNELELECGLQLADLVARPIGRKQLNPEQVNRAYDVLETKFLKTADDGVRGAGLETYP